MTVGSFSVEILSEGRFEIFRDGHINRLPKKISPTDQGNTIHYDNSVMVGINPVLIQTGSHNILLDTGLGWGLDAGSEYNNVSNVCTNLNIFGLEPQEITHVILSHLHYDHAAGASFTNDGAKTEATFPNAKYVIHQKEWDFALSQTNNRQDWFGAGYDLDDWYRLVSDGQINFVSDHTTEILDGITIIKTGGHTPGHQIIKIISNNEVAFYLGDLLPSSLHLNEYSMERADIHPLEAKKQKIQFLKHASEEKALMLFYHSINGHAGHVLKDRDQKYVLARQLPG